jgi:Glycosyl hydrolases family 18
MIGSSAISRPIIGQFILYKDNPGWDQRLREDTPFDLATRFSLAFGGINFTPEGYMPTLGDEKIIDRVKSLIGRIKKKNPSAEILLSLGNSSPFVAAAKSPEFPSNVVNFLKSYKLDGIDIDWEDSIEKVPLNELTNHLSREFQSSGYKLTLDGWPSPFSSYDMPVLQNSLSQINIMSYGASTVLSDCASSYISVGFPAKQLIGGIETEIHYESGTHAHVKYVDPKVSITSNVDTLGPGGTINAKAQYALGYTDLGTDPLAGMFAWREFNDYCTDPHRPNFPTYRGTFQLWESMGGLNAEQKSMIS